MIKSRKKKVLNCIIYPILNNFKEIVTQINK